MNKIIPQLKSGNKVKYNHAFLKSIGADYDTSIITGIVQSIKPLPNNKNYLVKVLWQGENEVKGCLTNNLTKMDYDITE